MPRHESPSERILPKRPVRVITRPLARFLHVEAASGVVLLLAAVVALVLANSPWAEAYLDFWKIELGITLGDFDFRHSLKHMINDGLMAIFFFVVGLEVKRELVLGELRQLRRAALPIVAALGGMLVPAALYLAVQSGGEASRGWGIPMATDIAFVVGCLAVLGERIPYGLRIMLLSLAIVDDIGAILVIAVGYTEDLNGGWLAIGLIGIAVVFGLAKLGVRSFSIYTAAGIVVWFAFHESGIHATIAGVILGLMTPARSDVQSGVFGELLDRVREVVQGPEWEALPHRSEEIRRFQHVTREVISPVEYLEGLLHPWVGFLIMPVFALANAGVPIHMGDITSTVALAVALGLIVGKPLGIVLFSWAAVKTGIADLPGGTTWRMVIGAGCLAGIGFTMALFIAALALEENLLQMAKIGVLGGSLVSASLGMLVLGTAKKPAAA